MSKNVLEELLSALENVKDANRLRGALGLPREAEPHEYAHPPQPKLAPEFPQWRVKMDWATGQEIDRKRCNSLDEVRGFNMEGYSYVLPIDSPLPAGKVEGIENGLTATAAPQH